MLPRILLYTICISLVNAIDTEYLDHAMKEGLQLDFAKIFARSHITTIIALYNESIFTHIERDMSHNHRLLACLDHAVSIVDLETKTAWALVGLPITNGYIEAEGTLAKFSSIASLAQINRTMLVVSDTNNNCLRWVDRTSYQTSQFAGKCGDQRIQEHGDIDISLSDLKFVAPGALLYQNITHMLYVADYEEVLTINITARIAHRLFKSTMVITGLALEGDKILASYNQGVFEIDSLSHYSLVTGNSAHKDDFHGDAENLNETVFDQIKDIQLLYQRIYAIAEYASNRVRGIDLKR